MKAFGWQLDDYRMASSAYLSTFTRSLSWGHPYRFVGISSCTRFLPHPQIPDAPPHEDIFFISLPLYLPAEHYIYNVFFSIPLFLPPYLRLTSIPYSCFPSQVSFKSVQITDSNSHLFYIHVCKVFQIHKTALIFILLLLNSFWPHFSIILKTWQCWYRESLWVWAFNSHSPQFEKFWVSALITAHCKKKLPCPWQV